MKTRTLLIAAALLALTGCTTSTARKLAKDLDAYDKLGVKEIVVTGKFSHTDYTVTHVDGVRRAEINHTNAWVPQIRVIRETKESK